MTSNVQKKVKDVRSGWSWRLISRAGWRQSVGMSRW